MQEIIQLDKQEYTLIGKNSKHVGDFSFFGITFVSGEISGNVKLLSGHQLSITPDGHINGTIECGDITIKGRFDGDIKSTGSVLIEPSAKVEGTIKALNLVVLPGAIINIKAEAES